MSSFSHCFSHCDPFLSKTWAWCIEQYRLHLENVLHYTAPFTGLEKSDLSFLMNCVHCCSLLGSFKNLWRHIPSNLHVFEHLKAKHSFTMIVPSEKKYNKAMKIVLNVISRFWNFEIWTFDLHAQGCIISTLSKQMSSNVSISS